MNRYWKPIRQVEKCAYGMKATNLRSAAERAAAVLA